MTRRHVRSVCALSSIAFALLCCLPNAPADSPDVNFGKKSFRCRGCQGPPAPWERQPFSAVIAGGFPLAGPEDNRTGGWIPGFGDPSPVPGANHTVNCLSVYDGMLVAAGEFIEVGGVHARRIAAWDGADWHALGAGLSGIANDLAVYDGDLIVAGNFWLAGESPFRRIAGWDGTAWFPLGEEDPDGHIYAMCPYQGDLYVAGDFTSVGGVSAQRIARWDGELWRPLGSGIQGNVCDLAVYAGDLIAAGSFESAGDVVTPNVARWDGTQWSPVGEGFGSGEMGDYQYVFALETYGDVLHAAGNFMQSGDRILFRAARWDAQAWQPMGAGTDDEVAVLCSGPFGLYAGGEFMGAGEAPSWRMGHWVADVSDVSLGSVRLAVDLCLPNPYRPGDTIRLHAPVRQPLGVAVYGVDGRRLARLFDDALFQGTCELRWDGRTPDGRRLQAGLYYLSAHSGNARVHTGFVLKP